MATSQEKFKLVFEAQEAASKKLRALNQQLADLGGPKMVKSQKEIRRLEREINTLSDGAKKGSMIFSRFTQGIAVGNIVATAVTNAFRGLKNILVGTITAAGDTERQWNMVTAALERHKLATDDNMLAVRQFADDMQTLTGIADEEFGRAVQTMVDRGASLSQAFKLVSATADVAASKNKDMSQVLNEIADVIGRKDLLTLEKYGVVVDKNVDFTTQLDQAIQQLNANFGGAASDVAQSYSVRVAVLQQKFGDLQEKVGTQLLPVLTELTNVAIHFIDEFSNIAFASQFDSQGKQVVDTGGTIIDMLKSINSHMTGWVNVTIGGARIIGNAFGVIANVIQQAASPVVDTFIMMAQVLHGDFSDAWDTAKGIVNNIGTEIGDVVDDVTDLADSFNQLVTGMNQISSVGTVVTETVVGSTQAATNAIEQMTLEIPKMVDDTSDFLDEEVTMATHGMVEITRSAVHATANAAQQMHNMIGNAVNSMIDNMVTGRQSFADIFKGIAEDFMIFFIKQALFMVTSMFIPGLGSLLGSIFDTPANDRMAARQGGDFMRWFIRGALAEDQGVSPMAVGITRSANKVVPVAAGSSGGGSGMVVLNVSVSGNVMTDSFIEKTVAPKLRQLVVDGRSLLNIKNENKTGGRDVSIV